VQVDIDLIRESCICGTTNQTPQSREVKIDKALIPRNVCDVTQYSSTCLSIRLINRNMNNIYIVGAQSTGKTTLVNALEAAFAREGSSQRPLVIREVARTVQKEKHFSRKDITTSPTRALQLQQYILAAQYDAEATICAANASAWYMCDRSGLDPIVYAKCFVGEDAAAKMLESEVWRELEDRMKDSIVILCEAGCHWLVDDGIRLMPKNVEEWVRVDAAFRDLLEKRGIGFSIMPKEMMDLQKRVEYVHRMFTDAQKQM
jgi:nicotinamide riboside kinase